MHAAARSLETPNWVNEDGAFLKKGIIFGENLEMEVDHVL